VTARRCYSARPPEHEDPRMRRFPFVLVALACLGGCAGAGGPAVPAAPASIQGAPVSLFFARGNEPGWRLDLDRDRMTLAMQDGTKRTVTPLPAAQRTDAFTRYAGRSEGADLTATIFNRRCRDTMTGMHHPNAVEVALGDRKLSGCGGDPATLLQGAEWTVTGIAGKGLIDRSRATLNFGGDGRVYGRGSCNNYTAEYRLTGEGLTVGKAAGTMMACDPAVMQQESLFLEVLRNVRGFDLREDGALVLRAGDGRTIVARR
jgi:heat shock protein HslJ